MSGKLLDVPLALLATRRALRPSVLLVTLLIALLLANSDFGLGATIGSALEAELGVQERDALERGLTRQALWTALLVWIGLVSVLHAARTVDGWKRRGDVDWLGASPSSRGCIAISTLCGQLFALVTLTLAAGALVELVVRDAPETLRQSAVRVAAPDSPWFTASKSTLWTLPAARPGSLFTFEASVADGGPGMDVVVVAQDGSIGGETIVGRREVQVQLEGPSSGPRGLRIAAGGWAFGVHHTQDAPPDVTGYLHPNSGRLWVACDSERRASGNLIARTLLGGAAWIALALGLGSWMRGSLAALLTGSAWIGASLWSGTLASWLPGARLIDALGVVGRGRVPEALGVELLFGTFVLVTAGLALASGGLRDWRRET